MEGSVEARMRAFGSAYPPSLKDEDAYFKKTPKKELSQAATDAVNHTIAGLGIPPEEWKYIIQNDFEISVFKAFPAIQKIKEELYENGAIYSQMSGSGSAVFGIFKNEPTYTDIKNEYFYYLQKPSS